MKRFLLSVAAAGVLLAGRVPMVSAGAEWCENDPVVVVRTSAGNIIPVHVTLSAQSPGDEADLRAYTISHTSQPANNGQATAVQIYVLIPDHLPDLTRFATRSVASDRPWAAGTIYDAVRGQSGAIMTLRFTMNVP